LCVVQFSVRENLLVVTGNPESKELKDLMPEILKQVGPQQYSFLKDIIKNIIPEGKAAEEDEDDVPDLVGNFEDASKK
jgi:nascent polypeptide-associated complex subunit beta